MSVSRSLAAALAAILVAGCSRQAEKAAAPEPSVAAGPIKSVTFTAEQIGHAGIQWTAVEAGTMATQVDVPARVVANEDRTARVSAPAEGRVLSVAAQTGDRVARGQVLVTLLSPQASGARAEQAKATAEIASREAALAYARSARERAERLLEAKAAARQDVERARADEQLAASSLAQARAESERTAAAVTQLAVDAAGRMILRAPIVGVVIARDALPGSVVQAGAPLVTITDGSSLWLDLAAPEVVAVLLRPGAALRFTSASFPGYRFEARVRTVGGALDPQTRTVPVRAIVANPDHRLLPGMFVSVAVESSAPTTGVRVPDAAVQLLDERPVVFVAKSGPDGAVTFERRDVELGAKAEGRTLIVKGITPGELVVHAGAFAVKSEFARSKMPAEG
jgi:cobalt-zinc-cadmium efflux system membrane fusion protein